MLTTSTKEAVFKKLYESDGAILPRLTKSRAANLAYTVGLKTMSLYVGTDEENAPVLDMCLTSLAGKEVWMRCYPRFVYVSIPGEPLPALVDYLGFAAWAEKTKIF
jgi:hypothetical protein